MRVKALWHISPSTSILQEQDLSTSKDLVIKSLYSLISTGTERLVATGQVPDLLKEPMSVPFMEGSFDFPFTYGYSLVGEVISEGEFKGRLVHLMHPHQDMVQVPAKAVYILPATIPSKRAILASNIETALTAIWDGQVSIGDRVLVVGFGMIGALVARLLSWLPAVKVVVQEKDKYRQSLAQQMGFEIRTSTDNNFDSSFHTTSSSGGLQSAIDAVGKEGTIVELSWYGKKESTLKLGGDFHYQRKRIISSQVGQIPSNKSHRWTYHRRKKVVFDLLQNPLFDQHLTHEVPFEETPSFFQRLRTGQLEKGLGWVVRY